MNWNDLQVVLAVARGGNLSAAARALGVNQTTVGRRLRALEVRLGHGLFVRGRPAFVPTEAGEAVIAHAERMESESVGLEAVLKLRDLKPRGLVRIATMPWIITALIVPALPAFANRYPDIEIETIGDVRERSLSKREAELALRFEMEPRGRERAITLAPVTYALYAPRGTDPASRPWIGFGEDVADSVPAQWLEHARATDERVVLRAHDAGFIHAAIRAGVGKGVIPDLLADGDPSLVRLSGPTPEFVRNLRALVHEDVQRMTRTVTVIEWLRDLVYRHTSEGSRKVGN